MALDKGALDRWITTEPNWHEVVIVTEENFSEFFGDDDIRLNELKCNWTGKHVGYTDWESGNDYGLSFTPFYVLDEDCEVLVNAEEYEESQARENERERELDRQYAEYLATKGENE
jgi:hypothetical protein